MRKTDFLLENLELSHISCFICDCAKPEFCSFFVMEYSTLHKIKAWLLFDFFNEYEFVYLKESICSLYNCFCRKRRT